VVHMLRGVLGDSLFYVGIDNYYHSQYQYGALTTEEFKNLWEQATGTQLDWFFDEWIHGTYLPNYYYYTYCRESDTGGYDFYLMVEQVQVTSPQVFTMPIDIYIDYDALPSDTLQVFNDERRQVFKFNLPDTVNYIVLDPAQWILCYKTFQDWEMFITTSDSELSTVKQGRAYNDTIEVVGGQGPYDVSIIAGAFPDGLTIDSYGVISGSTFADTGSYPFMVLFVDTVNNYSDYEDFTLHVVYGSNCCVGTVGNVDCSENPDPDISDITRLIDYIYLSHRPLCCPEEADTDLSGGEPDISDITRLIDFLYLSHDPLANCP
jgi:hypothetical protein